MNYKYCLFISLSIRNFQSFYRLLHLYDKLLCVKHANKEPILPRMLKKENSFHMPLINKNDEGRIIYNLSYMGMERVSAGLT